MESINTFGPGMDDETFETTDFLSLLDLLLEKSSVNRAEIQEEISSMNEMLKNLSEYRQSAQYNEVNFNQFVSSKTQQKVSENVKENESEIITSEKKYQLSVPITASKADYLFEKSRSSGNKEVKVQQSNDNKQQKHKAPVPVNLRNIGSIFSKLKI